MKKTPISIRTYKHLKENNLHLALYCLPCGRWHRVDLEAIIEDNKGDDIYVGQRFKCSKCGEIAEKQIQHEEWFAPHAANRP